jgi:hypothetical protein
MVSFQVATTKTVSNSYSLRKIGTNDFLVRESLWITANPASARYSLAASHQQATVPIFEPKGVSWSTEIVAIDHLYRYNRNRQIDPANYPPVEIHFREKQVILTDLGVLTPPKTGFVRFLDEYPELRSTVEANTLRAIHNKKTKNNPDWLLIGGTQPGKTKLNLKPKHVIFQELDSSVAGYNNYITIVALWGSEEDMVHTRLKMNIVKRVWDMNILKIVHGNLPTSLL